MQLAIANWPPLVSHLLAFLLGLWISRSDEVPAEQKPRFKAARAQLALTKGLVEASDSLAAGSPVALIKLDSDSKQASCRLLPDFSLLLQSSPFPVVELSLSGLQQWQPYFAARDKHSYRLIGLVQAAPLPLCVSTLPKVSYGSLR